MHPYFLQATTGDRIRALRRESDQHRLAEAARRVRPGGVSARRHNPLAGLLALRTPTRSPAAVCTC